MFLPTAGVTRSSVVDAGDSGTTDVEDDEGADSTAGDASADDDDDDGGVAGARRLGDVPGPCETVSP